jgi:hypothetical protein
MAYMMAALILGVLLGLWLLPDQSERAPDDEDD